MTFLHVTTVKYVKTVGEILFSFFFIFSEVTRPTRHTLFKWTCAYGENGVHMLASSAFVL